MFFDLKKSPINRALLLEKAFASKTVNRIVMILFVFLIGFLLLWFFHPSFLGRNRSFGLFLITASAVFGLWVYSLFLVSFLKNLVGSKDDPDNVASYLDFQAAAVVKSFLDGGQKDVSIILEKIFKIPGSEFVLYRIGINPKSFYTQLSEYLKMNSAEVSDQEFVMFLEDALSEAKKIGQQIITWREILLSLTNHSQYLNRFLFHAKLEKKDIAELLLWQKRLEQEEENRKKFWLKTNLMAKKGIGKDWAAGYTVRLDKFARDLTYAIGKRGFSAHLYGRKNETDAVERILARAGENNVIIVGEPGVGKRTMILALAKRILEGQTLPALAHKRVLELDVGAVLASSGQGHEVEANLKTVLDDAVKSGNVILLIDEIHTLFDREQAAGKINATELILPYLSYDSIQLIGITDGKNYNRTIAQNPSLLKSFEKVEVKEAEMENVQKIIQEVVPRIESHSQVLMTYQAIKQTIDLCDKYIKDVPFPEKAIDILQEAAVRAKAERKSSLVEVVDVEEVVHRRTEIPIGKIAMAEKEVLLDLEKVLHRKVVGQDEAIVAIANALRRSRSGIASEKKPIGSFLFLGPTGVGKTETAKALAATYFGSIKHMIRFDMSEYQQADSVKRLIGDTDQSGQLTTAVKDNPFSLLLLDEVEKADPNILNLFLQILDDGRLTASSGLTVDFTNSIIIMTSNAGAEMIRESIEQMREQNLKERLLDFLQKQGEFRPEFLNRFDAVIVYKPLTQDQTEQVATLLLADLNRRLKQKDVQLKITDELVGKLAKLGYSPEFGARPLRRVIQDKVENLFAKKLLSGEIKRGDEVEIKPEEIN